MFQEHAYNDYDLNPDPPHQPMYLKEVLRQLRAARARCVLDAGCGDGNFAESVAQAGFNVFGMDLSPTGVRRARGRGFGHFVQSSLYESLTAPFGRTTFDAIYIVEVVEHLYSPNRFASRAFEALRPGGVIVVTTPYWGYLKNLALAATNRMDAALTALWEGGHIKHFSRATLTRLMEEAGFEAVSFYGAGQGVRAHTPFLWSGMAMTFRKPAA
jgi:2-polyprenyl-6-hydroxyphenyl methylase/3-demethylubiquinone-9 3-methyltransferase